MGRMTIAQCKDAAFQLINQYSIVGSVVPLTYNDHADDDNRMLNLINDAQMTIATTSKPISASYEFEVERPDKKQKPTELSISMPEDFLYPTAVLFKHNTERRWREVDRRVYDTGVYRWLNDDTLLIPDRPAGFYRVEYARYPVRYDSSTNPDTVLDNSPDTHEAIPYYVAAMLYLDTDPYAYASLYNVWETKLARIGFKPAHATYTEITDVYDFNVRGDW